jgi:hypothetical protein
MGEMKMKRVKPMLLYTARLILPKRLYHKIILKFYRPPTDTNNRP